MLSRLIKIPKINPFLYLPRKPISTPPCKVTRFLKEIGSEVAHEIQTQPKIKTAGQVFAGSFTFAAYCDKHKQRKEEMAKRDKTNEILGMIAEGCNKKDSCCNDNAAYACGGPNKKECNLKTNHESGNVGAACGPKKEGNLPKKSENHDDVKPVKAYDDGACGPKKIGNLPNKSENHDAVMPVKAYDDAACGPKKEGELTKISEASEIGCDKSGTKIDDGANKVGDNKASCQNADADSSDNLPVVEPKSTTSSLNTQSGDADSKRLPWGLTELLFHLAKVWWRG